MSPIKRDNRDRFVTADRSVAERDARCRSSEQQVEYVLGVREYANGDVEYMVVPMDDFFSLPDSCDWLIDDSHGRVITPGDLAAIYTSCEVDDALLEATLRIAHGSQSLFMGHDDGLYVVAPTSAWPRFAAAGFVKLDEFAATKDRY